MPSETMKDIWGKVLMHHADYGKEAWTKQKTTKYLNKWTAHPSATCFTAPERDNGLRDLPFTEMVDYDNQLIGLQNNVGGVGAIASRILALMEEKAILLKGSAGQFMDGSVQMENPREEAAKVLFLHHRDLCGHLV